MFLHVTMHGLFGAVAGSEEGVAVPPAAFEGLLCWAGVIVQQVLLQVLHHPEDESTAMPPAAVVLNQVQSDSFYAPVIAACIDHALVDHHTHHHV